MEPFSQSVFSVFRQSSVIVPLAERVALCRFMVLLFKAAGNDRKVQVGNSICPMAAAFKIRADINKPKLPQPE